MEDYILFNNRDEWRAWLDKHHETETVVWVAYYKKHTKKTSVTYNEAVEEAICYGWIDGLVRRVDDEIYMQRYTPRKPNSKWSQSNLDRVEKMTAAGKMMPAGIAAVEEGKKRGVYVGYSSRKEFEMPDDLEQELKKDEEAYENFNNFARSTQHMYIGWIEDAKRQDTRKRRIAKVVEKAKRNEKTGLM